MPPWLLPIVASLPIYIQWMIPVALQMLQHYVFPAMEKAFPKEAPLIAAVAAWLAGSAPAPLVSAYHHFHAEHAKLAKP